ncbi:ribosome maturation factor RimM [Hydrogenivirga sp.]
MDYIIIGKIIDTFGVKGELKILPMAPVEVFERLRKVYLKRVGGEYVPFRVESVREHGNLFLLKFRGYDDLSSVEQFKGAHIFLPEKELPERGEDEFYAYELVGMEVITDKGKRLGKVKRVEDFGVYDMLVLEGERIMIPFVGDIILKVDREKKKIEVKEELAPL